MMADLRSHLPSSDRAAENYKAYIEASDIDDTPENWRAFLAGWGFGYIARTKDVKKQN